MSEFASQVQAHKARLQRFAEAAARHQRRELELAQMCVRAPVVDAVVSVMRAPDNAPLSWKILRAVAQEFDMTVSQMRCTSQNYQFVIPRHIAAGLLSEMTELSLTSIGNLLGGKDYTTILSAKRRYAALASEEAIRNRLDQMKAEIING